MNIFSNAKMIKAHFIEDILKGKITITKEKCIIGQEVIYGSDKLAVDLLIVTDSSIIAIEIKAQNDTFKRLSNQVINYEKTFDYTYVLITENHIKSVDLYDSQRSGLIILKNDGTFDIVKKAKKSLTRSKFEIIQSIPAAFLKNHYKITGTKSAHEVREIVERNSLKSMKDTLLLFYHKKLSFSYEAFLNEKGNLIHFEDVSILSLNGLKISL